MQLQPLIAQKRHRHHRGHRPGNQGGNGRTLHFHAASIDQKGVAADIHAVHQDGNQHGRAGIAHGAVNGRRGVIQGDEGQGDSGNAHVNHRVIHDFLLDGAKYHPQQRLPEEKQHRRNAHAQQNLHQRQLVGDMAGAFVVLCAQALSSDYRAAGGQGREQINHQNIDLIHQRHGGNRPLPHAGQHQRIRHAHQHGQRLFRNGRQNHSNDVLPAEKQPLRRFAAQDLPHFVHPSPRIQSYAIRERRKFIAPLKDSFVTISCAGYAAARECARPD